MASKTIAINDFKVICRLCGEESFELIKLNIRKNKQKSLKESIKKYLDIKVTPGDGMPDQICGPCIAKLDETVQFIEKCMNTQVKLQNILEENIPSEKGNLSDMKVETEFEESSALARTMVSSVLSEDSPAQDDTGDNSKLNESFDISVNNGSEESSDQDDSSIKEESTNETAKKKNTRGRGRPRKSEGLPFPCSQCSKTFARAESLKSHVKRQHDKLEKCPECAKVFRSSYLRRVHIRTHKNAEMKYSCSQCSKSFATPTRLAKHKDTHIPLTERQNFDCTVCGKSFATRVGMERHVSLHSNPEPFMCDQCGKAYRSKNDLTVHIRLHSGEYPYECAHCTKRFRDSRRRKMHELTHEHSRPFACGECERRFTSPFAANRHRRIHTGMRPYPCRFCPKCFRDSWKRKVHERIHTGERPYACRHCPAAFCESGNLYKHCRNVHNEHTDQNTTTENEQQNSTLESERDKDKDSRFSAPDAMAVTTQQPELRQEDYEQRSQDSSIMVHQMRSQDLPSELRLQMDNTSHHHLIHHHIQQQQHQQLQLLPQPMAGHHQTNLSLPSQPLLGRHSIFSSTTPMANAAIHTPFVASREMSRMPQ